jgi:putative aldouronate transport system permease protein
LKIKTSPGRVVFFAFAYSFLVLAGLLCLLPMIHVLAVSFSKSTAVNAGLVSLWPVDLSLKSYEYVINKVEFLRALFVGFERVLLGVPVNMALTILIAYPLSKDRSELAFRKVYTWFFMITILFSGGLIPWYMVISKTGLIDSIWALILPTAVPVFNMVILMNFFRGLPKEIEESAFLDGASYLRILWKIYVPLSVPALATLTLFSAVHHWNSWFDGIILMNRTEHYPLQSYMQTVIVQMQFATNMRIEDVAKLSEISDQTNKAAQVFVGALPILALYPFLQRYFMTGIVLGSVKG